MLCYYGCVVRELEESEWYQFRINVYEFRESRGNDFSSQFALN